MKSIEYRDTERKLEVKIYGLVFEINIKEFENIDTRNISENEDLEKIIDKILGEGASKKINDKRVSDGYEEMNSNVALTIIAFITNMYIDNTMKPMDSTINKYNSYDRKIRNVRRNNRYRR